MLKVESKLKSNELKRDNLSYIESRELLLRKIFWYQAKSVSYQLSHS